MKHDITLPRLTETMEQGTITRWEKGIGEFTAKGDVLYEVETDKMTIQVESVDTGYLSEIIVRAGETASVGERIGSLSDTEEECSG